MVHIQKEASNYQDTTHSMEVKQLVEIFHDVVLHPLSPGVHGQSMDPAPGASCLKKLGINISERLEFQHIPAWVQQKHRGLFAR